VSAICKLWFGEPISLENWVKNQKTFFSHIVTRANELGARIAALDLDGKEKIIGT